MYFQYVHLPVCQLLVRVYWVRVYKFEFWNVHGFKVRGTDLVHGIYYPRLDSSTCRWNRRPDPPGIQRMSLKPDFPSNYGPPCPAVYINFVQITYQIQVLSEHLCRAQAIFYALPNNERGTKYRGLTYSAEQNCPWICRATYEARQTRMRVWSVSITVVRSIETSQTTPNHYCHYYWHIMPKKDTNRLFWGERGSPCPQSPHTPGSGTCIVQEYIQW